MTVVQGFMNIYAAGVFHRQGKPLTCDYHAGDVYQTEAAAKSQIDDEAGYVGTFPVTFEVPGEVCWNAADSEPKPLSQTRPQIIARSRLQQAQPTMMEDALKHMMVAA